MTNVLKSHKWKPKGGSRAKYPWDDWLDGQIREARQGTHYTCTDRAFVQQVAKASAIRKVVCRVEISEAGRIVFQCPYSERRPHHSPGGKPNGTT